MRLKRKKDSTTPNPGQKPQKYPNQATGNSDFAQNQTPGIDESSTSADYGGVIKARVMVRVRVRVRARVMARVGA
eukprot:100159-Amorphochlora_amoeboformis.AAC.1